MRRLLVLCILGALSPLCAAEVIRCADSAGNVSYTDGACAPGSRPVGRVAVPDPPPPGRIDRNPDGGPQVPAPRAPVEAVEPPPRAPGLVIIDPRAGTDRPADERRSDRGSDAWVIDDGYGYPGAYRPAAPPRDMRPRIRQCDATGCQDTQGNHYDRSGRLDRYQGLDGRACRPVGTTTLCR